MTFVDVMQRGEGGKEGKDFQAAERRGLTNINKQYVLQEELFFRIFSLT